MCDCPRKFAFVSVHDPKSWFVAGVWTALDLWCLWLAILNWPMLTWRLQRKTQPTTPKPYKRHDLGVSLLFDVTPNRSWKIHHAGGVQRIMEGKLWDKMVCIFLVIWAEEWLWWLETSWNCRLGQILLVWASGESEAVKQLWDQTERHGAIQERLSSSKGNLLDAKKSKQPWAWRCFMIFHMKTCVDKISLDTSSYCWNDMDLFQYLQSSCERIEDESNMMHFLSIAVNHFNELLSAEKSTLASTHYDCPSVVGRSRAHRCACKHQSQGKRGQVLSTRILCNMEVFTTSQHLTDLTASPGWRKARWSSAEVPKIWVSWTVPKLSIHLR